MILEKSWVGDYQSIRYLAENSTLAENLKTGWNPFYMAGTNLPSTNTKRKFETIGRNAKRWNYPEAHFTWIYLALRPSRSIFDIPNMPIIKLQSSDGETFPVDVDIARQSVTIRKMLEDLGIMEGEEEDDDVVLDEVVTLPNVTAAILKRVIQWCTYHEDDPSPSDDDEAREKTTDDISSWDSDFLKVRVLSDH